MALLKSINQLFTADTKPLSTEQLLDSLGDVVLLIDNQDRIQYVNHCWESITGKPASQSKQQRFQSFLHPEDVNSWQQAKTRLLDSGESQLSWFRLIGPDGDIRWCEMRTQWLDVAKKTHFSATLCDITPQVRKEQLLNASHRSLTTLVNRLPAMIYRSRNNLSWSMEYVSDGCLELTGHPAESLINNAQLSFGSLIHPTDSERVWEEVQTALQRHENFDMSYRLIRANGTTTDVIDKGKGNYSKTGEVVGVEGLIFSVDQAKTTPVLTPFAYPS